MRSFWQLATPVALISTLAGAPLSAQARYNIHFRAPSILALPGEVATVEIGMDNQPDRVTGFSFGVKHDGAKLELQSVDIGPAVQAALGAGAQPDDQFFVVNKLPDGGPGFTVAMILSAQSDLAIPAGLDHSIFSVKYRLPAAATGAARLDITGDLGSPGVDVILDLNGKSQVPEGVPATTSANVVANTGAAPFIRGDGDQSNSYSIVDGLITLNFLFAGGTIAAGAATIANCPAALNADGSVGKGTPDVEDALDIDISDAVFILTYIFRRGAEPPAPFPRCGLPATPAAQDFVCVLFTCKP